MVTLIPSRTNLPTLVNQSERYKLSYPPEDYRVFFFRTGAYVASDILFTVPSGYYFYITHLVRALQNGSLNDTITISDSSGAYIFQVVSDGTGAGYQEGRNLVPELKLLPGDYIETTTDLNVGQYIGWMIQGQLQKIN